CSRQKLRGQGICTSETSLDERVRLERGRARLNKRQAHPRQASLRRLDPCNGYRARNCLPALEAMAVRRTAFRNTATRDRPAPLRGERLCCKPGRRELALGCA